MTELKPSSEFTEDGMRLTPTGCGELGLALEKHLARWPFKISEADFFAWAKTEDMPTGDHREALREALLIMDADETRRALFDGRASKGPIAKLVVRCGGNENRLWNNLLRLTNPQLRVRELPYNLLWDKEMMWGQGGGDSPAHSAASALRRGAQANVDPLPPVAGPAHDGYGHIA